MDNLVRTDTVFGKRVNIVGNISADLVLESLGKVYIKSRNKSQTLEEIITSLTTTDPNVSTSRTKVVEGIEGLDTSEFKDGTFVFDKLSSILYIFIDDELIELINVAPEGTGYVKRSGDTMTGRLAIYVKNGPPLYVNSANLVENLNAQYLNGETAASFTRRNANEKIGGEWTFRSKTTFDSNTLFYKDIVAHGSIGSPNFSSGFRGYGWRMDADTNTLTIDNLVVRKLMQVYELVVNRISATNGSLWVTNAGKVVKAQKLEIKESSFFNLSSEVYCDFAAGMEHGRAFIKLNTNLQDQALQTIPADNLLNPNGQSSEKQCWANDTLQNAKVILVSNGNTDLSSTLFSDPNATDYHTYPLFSSDFKFDCAFPIITREVYRDYKEAEKTIPELEQQLEALDPESGLYDTLQLQLTLQYDKYNYARHIKYIKSYFKYFANGDYYLVAFDNDSLPVFKPGDIVRCQKWTYEGIKYYDGVVCNLIDNSYVIQLAKSILDIKTTIKYDSSLEPEYTIQEDDINLTLYNSSKRTNKYNHDYSGTEEEQLTNNLIGLIEKDDSIVQMGNLWDAQRQNAVYITSTDNGAPYMDILSGINRPDFSVIYYVPIFRTIKLHASTRQDNPPLLTSEGSLIPQANVLDVTYTGDYYIQSSPSEYTYIEISNENNTSYFLVKGYYESIQTSDAVCKILYHLNTQPDQNTLLGEDMEEYQLLLEDGGFIELQTVNGEDYSGYYMLLEEKKQLLQVASTRTTKVRLGNLDGIQDELFPIDKQPYGYGLYGENVFLVGEFYLSNGRSLAEIGYDAITFAIAAQNATYNSLEILRRDYAKADKLLQKAMYSKAQLQSAGMRIGNDELGNPGIVLWGNQILIATTQDEFDGKVFPTVLFADGKIKSKFIDVYDVHSAWHTGASKHIVQLLGNSDGTDYYYEQEVTQKMDNGNPVLDAKGNPIWQYEDTNHEIVEVDDSKVYEAYDTYGWHLKALGDGYLAKGNINWTDDGELSIKGNFIIQSPNQIEIRDSNGKQKLIIGDRFYTSTGIIRANHSLASWLSGNAFYYLNAFNLTYSNGRALLYNLNVTEGAQIILTINTFYNRIKNQTPNSVNITITGMYDDYVIQNVTKNSQHTFVVSNLLYDNISIYVDSNLYALIGTITVTGTIVTELSGGHIGIMNDTKTKFMYFGSEGFSLFQGSNSNLENNAYLLEQSQNYLHLRIYDKSLNSQDGVSINNYTEVESKSRYINLIKYFTGELFQAKVIDTWWAYEETVGSNQRRTIRISNDFYSNVIIIKVPGDDGTVTIDGSAETYNVGITQSDDLYLGKIIVLVKGTLDAIYLRIPDFIGYQNEINNSNQGHVIQLGQEPLEMVYLGPIQGTGTHYWKSLSRGY